MQNKKIIIKDYLNEIFPNASCELTYSTDYGFLIAVMLSAQTTDKKVNLVTKELFKRFDSLDKLNNASVEDIESIIKPLGLYKHKAKNIKEIANKLINEFNYVVPSDKRSLMSLNGVGNKTSNVIRAEIFKIPEFPVDTHVKRISNRLGLVDTDNVDEIESVLKKEFDEKDWIKLHHQFIHFGRYICKATNPNCLDCKFSYFCKYYCKN